MIRPTWYEKLPLELIEKVAKLHGLDPLLIAAICYHESRGVQWAVRYEAHCDKYVLSARDYASRLGISAETERELQKMSWSLPQIMGFLARELGFQGHLTELCQPEISLHLMGLHLKRLFQRYGYEPDVISAYNQGSPRKTPGGMYQNQRYVDDVSRYLREIQE